MDMYESGISISVRGNHDDKLFRKLQDRNVIISNGLQESLDQLSYESMEFKERVKNYLETLKYYYLFDNNRLAVSHAGLKEEYLGEENKQIQKFCLYGEPTGQYDSLGLPIRHPWAQDYKGNALIVYGHTVVLEPEWINNTLNIDTGCVFGGKLTAFRYPEREIVSVDALKTYYKREITAVY